MFGETCHDMAYERHVIEEKEAAARAEAQTNTMTIAQFAERTQNNINEMGLMLAGCARGKVDEGQIAEVDNRMFMAVSDEISGRVMVVKATGVMYWASDNSYNRGTLTLLVNADGTPRIWEG